jgi:hypothetical protein
VKLLTRGRDRRGKRCAGRGARVSAAMPILDRIRSFLASPQGRRVTDHGRRLAADPRNQERARGLLARLRRR